MKRRLALSLFLATCILLAFLLWIRAITPFMGGAFFAISLAAFAGLARGLTRD